MSLNSGVYFLVSCRFLNEVMSTQAFLVEGGQSWRRGPLYNSSEFRGSSTWRLGFEDDSIPGHLFSLNHPLSLTFWLFGHSQSRGSTSIYTFSFICATDLRRATTTREFKISLAVIWSACDWARPALPSIGQMWYKPGLSS